MLAEQEQEHREVLQTKSEEFAVVREQKDEMIRELTEKLTAKQEKARSLEEQLGELRASSHALQKQKEKIEAKLSEQC